MVSKVGQRKFLLKCGYTNEQLDRMSPSMAHSIIGDIEKARNKERQAIREAEEEKARKQQFKEDVKEAMEEIVDEASKETAREIMKMLKDNCRFGWTNSLDFTYNQIAKKYDVKVEE